MLGITIEQMGLSFQTLFLGHLLTFCFAYWLTCPRLAHANFQVQFLEIPTLLVRQICFFMLAFLTWQLVRLSNTMGYLLIAPFFVWVITEWWGATWSILVHHPRSSPIHRQPWRSYRLSEFWGLRWNVWVSRWLARLTPPCLNSPSARLWWGFSLSALGHELLFAVPYYLATGHRYFGLMSVYFLLQGLGVHWQKHSHLKASSFSMRLWTWSWILIWSPLFTLGPLAVLVRGVTS